MRIAMMQMAMTEDMERNLQVSYEAVKEAAGADLLFFPEVQHMPFLPPVHGRRAAGLSAGP